VAKESSEKSPARTTVHVTAVLNAASAGDQAATDELLPLVYEELRTLARQRLSHEAGGGGGLTLQPTALVHEAYLRLLGESEVKWSNRGHFFAAAAHAMRRIMIERARKHKAAKHGGGRHKLTLDEGGGEIAVDDHGEQLLDLERAMTQLEARDRRKADIVMLRFFAGLSIEQTAIALDLSPATVKNEWRFARAWLHSEMGDHGADN
jgi:RNA polymerase sigma factor (TIGR02999 family)